jgi:hypothetical protein
MIMMVAQLTGSRDGVFGSIERDLALTEAFKGSITSGDFQYHIAYLRQYHVENRLESARGSSTGMASICGKILAPKSSQIGCRKLGGQYHASEPGHQTIDLLPRMG